MFRIDSLLRPTHSYPAHSYPAHTETDMAWTIWKS